MLQYPYPHPKSISNSIDSTTTKPATKPKKEKHGCSISKGGKVASVAVHINDELCRGRGSVVLAVVLDLRRREGEGV